MWNFMSGSDVFEAAKHRFTRMISCDSSQAIFFTFPLETFQVDEWHPLRCQSTKKFTFSIVPIRASCSPWKQSFSRVTLYQTVHLSFLWSPEQATTITIFLPHEGFCFLLGGKGQYYVWRWGYVREADSERSPLSARTTFFPIPPRIYSYSKETAIV